MEVRFASECHSSLPEPGGGWNSLSGRRNAALRHTQRRREGERERERERERESVCVCACVSGQVGGFESFGQWRQSGKSNGDGTGQQGGDSNPLMPSIEMPVDTPFGERALPPPHTHTHRTHHTHRIHRARAHTHAHTHTHTHALPESLESNRLSRLWHRFNSPGVRRCGQRSFLRESD